MPGCRFNKRTTQGNCPHQVRWRSRRHCLRWLGATTPARLSKRSLRTCTGDDFPTVLGDNRAVP
ncbi:hypothetical protein Xazr_09785 [Xanthomonas campestris pv. azadirachtae]|nr:hypothetical protein Xazr_09785 [Xanthomonas campestris pv. azadirachtae]